VRKVVSSLFSFLLAVSLAGGISEHAVAGLAGETVASVNADTISVLDLREALGFWGGGVSASGIPEEKKKEALDRLIAGRLLEQSARSKGMDNTAEFRNLLGRREPELLIPALFRGEAASRVRITEEEIKAEVRRLKKADKSLSAEDARKRAKGAVWEAKIRKAEADLVAIAREEAPGWVNEEALGKIGGSDNVADNVVLGTAGPESVTYGDVKQLLQQMGGGRHGKRDLSGDPAAVRRVLERYLTRIALTAYGKKVGIGESEWMGRVRRELERTILIDLLVEKVILKGAIVTDKEIRDAYARHSGMLVRDGKPIPLPEVKEEIRRIVQGEKRKSAIEKYVGQLRKKAKIRTYGKLLPKV